MQFVRVQLHSGLREKKTRRSQTLTTCFARGANGNIMRRQISRKGPHMNKTDLITIERVEKAIYVIRGEKVMLDRDLAELYEVPTKALNQAVRRNLDRFPADFMFQVSQEEAIELNLSQFVTGSERYRSGVECS